MELNWILFLVLLVIYPMVWYFGSYSKAGIGEKPIIFNNPLFVLFGNLSVVLFIVISIWLIFVNWKTFLLVILIIMISGYLKGYVGRYKYKAS